MLTPQEVADKRFEKALISGYVTLEVDEFLEQVTEDYSTLYKENQTLKNKLRVLIGKVEEYRSVDSAMRQQLFEAQKKGDAIVAEAKLRADAILQDSQEKARTHAQAYNQDISAEEKRLEYAKRETMDFVQTLRELYQRQLQMLSVIPEMEVTPKPREVRQDTIDNVAREIEDSLSKKIQEQESMPFMAEKAAPAPAAEVPAQPAPKDAVPEIHTYEMSMGRGLTEVSRGDSNIWETQKEDTQSPLPRFDHEELMFGHSLETKTK